MKKLGLMTQVLFLGMGCCLATNARADQYLAFSQNDKEWLYLDSEATQPVIEFFDQSTGALTHYTSLEYDPARQLMMGFTPDGFKLAVLEKAGLSIWHNQTGKRLRTLPVPDLPDSIPKYQPKTAIANASGTAQLFYAPKRKQLRVVHTGNGKQLGHVDLSADPIALGMDTEGRKATFVIRAATGGYSLQMYNLYKNQLEKSISLPQVSSQSVFSQPIVLSQDGNYLVWLPYLIHVISGEVQHLVGANKAAFTNDNQKLVVANAQGLQRYDLATGAYEPLNIEANCQTLAQDINPTQTLLGFIQRCGQEFVAISLNAQTGQFIKRLKLDRP